MSKTMNCCFFLAYVLVLAITSIYGSPVPSETWLTPCMGSQPSSTMFSKLTVTNNPPQPVDADELEILLLETRLFATNFKIRMMMRISDKDIVNYLQKTTPPVVFTNINSDSLNKAQVISLLHEDYGKLSELFILVENSRLEREKRQEYQEIEILQSLERKIRDCLCELSTRGIKPASPLSRNNVLPAISPNSRSEREMRDYQIGTMMISVLNSIISRINQYKPHLSS